MWGCWSLAGRLWQRDVQVRAVHRDFSAAVLCHLGVPGKGRSIFGTEEEGSKGRTEGTKGGVETSAA